MKFSRDGIKEKMKIGNILVLKKTNKYNPKYGWIWECLCDCGKECELPADSFKNNKLPSCGCQKNKRKPKTHGYAIYLDKGGKYLSEYRSWLSMKARCKDGKKPSRKVDTYKHVEVCERWQSFENFIADMGDKPSPEYQLDRIDNSKNYTPENCRWATVKEQSLNRTSNVHWNFNGETMTIFEWAQKLNISPRVLYLRRTHGWSIERALTQKVRRSPSRNIK